eukprot:scaffold198759_cov35-Attheya_sp.AAC.1
MVNLRGISFGTKFKVNIKIFEVVKDSLERFNWIFGIFSKCSSMFTNGGLLVCKKWTNIRTLHQLVDKSSDKTG